MRKVLLVVVAALAIAVAGVVVPARGSDTGSTLTLNEFTLSDAQLGALRDSWYAQVEAKHEPGDWVPLRMELGDSELATMGLPSKQTLLSTDLSRPTKFEKGQGAKPEPSPAGPAVAVVAGSGWAGIRPGAWLILMDESSIGWCSAAHVYGSAGNYSISTAGHCGKVGDKAYMLGAVGGDIPVLVEIGQFSKSTGDGGIGKDWALISIYSSLQSLVTPTMAFWGGPIGTYTSTGEVAGGNLLRGQVYVNPNPTLVQGVVHYGHGAGIGAGGTPRAATAINWRTNYFTAIGAITPGDSGSGSNTATGDSVGSQRECAGINTHIYYDLTLRTGIGTFAGTRCTLVTATLANGQLVPYPAPAPGLP